MGENETSYKGTIVSAEVAAELQTKPIADFLHFEKGPKGNMIMTAKLPEWGRTGKNPEDKDFRIRENMNYFMRGLARSALDAKGNIDVKKALEASDQLDDPLLQGKVPENFLKACGVPKDRIEDFKLFIKACSPRLGQINANFAQELTDLQTFQYNMTHIEEEPELTEVRKDLVVYSYQSFKNILDNYRRMAKMDPEKETSIMLPVVAQDYVAMNTDLSNLSNTYHNNRGESYLPVEAHTTTFKSPDRKYDNQNSFISTVNIKGKNKVIALEAMNIPLDRMLECPQGTRTGTGIYDSVEELENYHIRNSETILPDEESLKKCRQLGKKKLAAVTAIAPSETFEKEYAAQLRHAALKEAFQENVRLIQKTIPDFTMTDEEIEKYITPERIELHDRAVKIGETYEKKLEVKNAPASYARVVHVLLDRSGTPEGKARNERTARLLKDPSKAGDDFRRELFAEIGNRVQTLDIEKLDPQLPLEERMKYCFDNMDTCELSYEFQKLSDKNNLEEMGFAIPAEQMGNHKEIVGKAVIFGGEGMNYRETAANDFFLTFPFESLSEDQLAKLFSQEKKFKKEPGAKSTGGINAQLPKFLTFMHKDVVREEYREPEKHVYAKEELQSVLPALATTKEKFGDIYARLKNADNWYNLLNSGAYRRLLTALKGLNDTYARIEGEQTIGDEQKAALVEGIRNVEACADEYVQHVGQTPRNDIQKYRRDLAKALKADAELLLGPAKDAVGSGLDRQVNAHNEMAVNKFYKTLKGDLGYNKRAAAQGEKELTEEQQQEMTFKKGLKRTEELRAEVEKLEKKPGRTDAEDRELEADRLALDARDELTNMVGRTEIDRERAKSLLATVMVVTQYKAMLKIAPDKVKSVGDYVEHDKNSKALDTITEGLTGKQINKFLTDDGEKAMIGEFTKAKEQLAPKPAVQDPAPEVPQVIQNEEKKKAGPPKGIKIN